MTEEEKEKILDEMILLAKKEGNIEKFEKAMESDKLATTEDSLAYLMSDEIKYTKEELLEIIEDKKKLLDKFTDKLKSL